MKKGLSEKAADDAKKFWVVMKRFGGTRPAFRHATKESAVKEAKRLTEATGGIFFVLEVVGVSIENIGWIDA